MQEKSNKKTILVVGGLYKNIPTWVRAAFNIDHYEQETHFKKTISSKPDLVVIIKSWISHKQFNDAREFADNNNVPLIVADNGWASAVQKAVENGLDWFAHAIDNTLNSLSEKDAKLTDELLNRAWEGAYRREYERSNALEKRLRKDREKLEEALAKVNAAERRENAAERVIAEVREAARQHKESKEDVKVEIQKVMRIIDSFLMEQEKTVSDIRRRIQSFL